MPLEQLITHLQIEFTPNRQNLEQQIEAALAQLIPYSLDIPYPGEGQTFQRWQILSQVATLDLSLAKIFESHLDALAILHELRVDTAQATRLHAVWAAEGGPQPLRLQQDLLSGLKLWCSAAEQVQQALLTYRNQAGQSQLLLVDLQQPGIQINTDTWQAVGMQPTRTAEVSFQRVTAEKIAGPNAYLERPGFWHGAAGVAACWFGATLKIAAYLHQATLQKPNLFKQMYLGEVFSQIVAIRALFKAVAAEIDAAPQFSHEQMIRALRAQVEATALSVIELSGKALGAAPFCQTADFARCVADLQVFLRQSHAAFDLQAIGELVPENEAWTL